MTDMTASPTPSAQEAALARPKNLAFASPSGTSVTEPSIETIRSPQQNTPGAPPAPVGPATCSNSIRTGSAPSFRCRATN